jgi:hypothetical protein
MFAILARLNPTTMLNYGNECERSPLLCSACVRRAEAGFAGLPTAIGLGGQRVLGKGRRNSKGGRTAAPRWRFRMVCKRKSQRNLWCVGFRGASSGDGLD